MAFFQETIEILQLVIIAIGSGFGVFGILNLLEGYGSDNPSSRSQGVKQIMAAGGIVLIGVMLVPQLTTLFPDTTAFVVVDEVWLASQKVVIMLPRAAVFVAQDVSEAGMLLMAA